MTDMMYQYKFVSGIRFMRSFSTIKYSRIVRLVGETRKNALPNMWPPTINIGESVYSIHYEIIICFFVYVFSFGFVLLFRENIYTE